MKDYSVEKFPLSNTVLYIKGWYKKSNNELQDLMKTLCADGYSPSNSIDVFYIILDNFNEWNNWLREKHPSKHYDLNKFITSTPSLGLRDEGYFTDIIIDKIFYIWKYVADNQVMKLSKPDFKVLPYAQKHRGQTNKQINEYINSLNWIK